MRWKQHSEWQLRHAELKLRGDCVCVFVSVVLEKKLHHVSQLLIYSITKLCVSWLNKILVLHKDSNVLQKSNDNETHKSLEM